MMACDASIRRHIRIDYLGAQTPIASLNRLVTGAS
jgi:hypothetical protein